MLWLSAHGISGASHIGLDLAPKTFGADKAGSDALKNWHAHKPSPFPGLSVRSASHENRGTGRRERGSAPRRSSQRLQTRLLWRARLSWRAASLVEYFSGLHAPWLQCHATLSPLIPRFSPIGRIVLTRDPFARPARPPSTIVLHGSHRNAPLSFFDLLEAPNITDVFPALSYSLAPFCPLHLVFHSAHSPSLRAHFCSSTFSRPPFRAAHLLLLLPILPFFLSLIHPDIPSGLLHIWSARRATSEAKSATAGSA